MRELGFRTAAPSWPRIRNGALLSPASTMMVLGGRVNGGLYGTAPNLSPDPRNPTLENNAADVHYETDFRGVYAKVIDNWLGADSRALLGADFTNPSLTFI